MRWALHQISDRLRMSYGKKIDKAINWPINTVIIWSTMTLNNTTAKDTGKYSCQLISDSIFGAIFIRKLFRTKYVYFFGS